MYHLLVSIVSHMSAGPRLAYDAAITKVEKMRNNKKEKEKERNEAEDEYARAKSR